MSDYQSSKDIPQIPLLLSLAPQEGKAFIAFDQAVKCKDGLIPLKPGEFIALAVALTTQCAYCLDAHTQGAK